MTDKRARLAPDLELLRMGLTPPEVEALAWHDPCNLLSSITARGLLSVALQNDSALDQFLERMSKWRHAIERVDYTQIPRPTKNAP